MYLLIVSNIWFYHCRLGNPSFSVLKIIFPHLFENLDTSKLHCEACALAKHTRVSFPTSKNRSSQPFKLIHGDVWGLSTITKISGHVGL